MIDNADTPQVNGFQFLPPKLGAWINSYIPAEDFEGPIPFQPLAKPLAESTVAMVTSAGISLKGDAPFNMTRELEEPLWGDPSYRCLPGTTTAAEIDVNHLHINTDYIKQDINVILPLQRLDELVEAGGVGGVAPTAYSFYGFQWERKSFLETSIKPIIAQMKSEAVDAVLLTPA